MEDFKHPMGLRDRYRFSKSGLTIKLSLILSLAVGIQSVAVAYPHNNATINKKKLANKAVITGKVVDETGVGLPGVSIKIKGTTNGTVSDATGSFTINAPDNAVLKKSQLQVKLISLLV
jgi:hypothetical protein